jgi:hypothetical protein
MLKGKTSFKNKKLEEKISFQNDEERSEFKLWVDVLGEWKYSQLYEITRKALKAEKGAILSAKELFSCARYESRFATIMYSVFRFLEFKWRHKVIEYLKKHRESKTYNIIALYLKPNITPQEKKTVSVVIREVNNATLTRLAYCMNTIMQIGKDSPFDDDIDVIRESIQLRNKIMHQNKLLDEKDVKKLMRKSINLLGNNELKKKKLMQINNIYHDLEMEKRDYMIFYDEEENK